MAEEPLLAKTVKRAESLLLGNWAKLTSGLHWGLSDKKRCLYLLSPTSFFRIIWSNSLSSKEKKDPDFRETYWYGTAFLYETARRPTSMSGKRTWVRRQRVLGERGGGASRNWGVSGDTLSPRAV